jgi:quercetin dioxygenase-like cupin family protein
MAQSISGATQPVISRHIWSRTQGERILWVDLTDKIEYGVGEVVHYPPNVASTKKERQAGESWKMLEKLR